MDDTTYQDAMDVIEKYRLKIRIPIEVLHILGNGLHNQKTETPKRAKIENYVIANNNNCLEAMEETAKTKGYKVIKMQIFGDIKDTVKKILENIPEGQNTCLILGGESTVRISGKGEGGRNQELVLRILKNTQKLKKITIASMGTDGIDGNSNFAGAIIENIKVDLTIMKEFLKNNDSSRFFQKQKANIKTDFTHMNLMDIGIILK
jgi:hydroxypyruvate reductase